MRPFNTADTHGILRLPSSTVRASSEDLDWSSLYVSTQIETPFEGIFEARDTLVVLFRDPLFYNTRRGGLGSRGSAPADSLRIVPGGTKLEVCMQSTCETVHLYIRRHVLEEVALETVEGDPRRVEIFGAMIPSDRILARLVDAAEAAVLAGNNNRLYADVLARTIAARLIEGHSAAQLKRYAPNYPGRTVSREVANAIDYMRSNLEQNISLDELAYASRCSASHLSRLFSAQTGTSPHRYLVEMRLNKAKELLETSNISLAEIAVMCGFTHQEHLTRLFRRYHNVTPGAYRNSVRQ